MNRSRKILQWVLLIAVISFVAVIRIRLLDFPLERDEGEYAYFGQLILQGIPPYKLAYNMKFPGVYYAYAVIMALFGQTIRGIHLGFLFVNVVTVTLVFFLAKKLVSEAAAVISCAAYAVLSLNSSVLGFAAHATHFVILPAIAGFLVLLKAFESDKRAVYLCSGILFGLAFIMKQSGIFFSAFGVLAIVCNQLSPKPIRYKKVILDVFAFLLGVLCPILILLFALYRMGVFNTFWFWTVTYLSKYGSQIPLSFAAQNLKAKLFNVIDGFYPLWALSAFGIIILLLRSKLKKNMLILLFVLFSFLTVCPGFYFRPHYFITLLPAVAILTGIFFDYLNNRAVHNDYFTIGLFLIITSIGIIGQKDYLFIEKPEEICRKLYKANPFPESIEIAKFIRSKTDKDDTIVVMGSEPQIYFYSGRRSATGYIHTDSLMKRHSYNLTMQKEMIQEIESSKPEFFIFVNISSSWLVKSDSEGYIFDWANRYMSQEYELVGVVDIFSDRTVYKWDYEARRYVPKSKFHILVLERR